MSALSKVTLPPSAEKPMQLPTILANLAEFCAETPSLNDSLGLDGGLACMDCGEACAEPDFASEDSMICRECLADLEGRLA
jgi:hypothetical protein